MHAGLVELEGLPEDGMHALPVHEMVRRLLADAENADLPAQGAAEQSGEAVVALHPHATGREQFVAGRVGDHADLPAAQARPVVDAGHRCVHVDVDGGFGVGGAEVIARLALGRVEQRVQHVDLAGFEHALALAQSDRHQFDPDPGGGLPAPPPLWHVAIDVTHRLPVDEGRIVADGRDPQHARRVRATAGEARQQACAQGGAAHLAVAASKSC